MKRIFLTFALTSTSIFSNAQVGVGTTTPDASSVLEVQSTTQGMLTPRMTNAQRAAISTPATGLIVYQTDGTAGFYYYTGSAWALLINGTDALPAVNGSAVTNLNATNITTGTISPARMGSGTADNTTYLRGDGTWSTPAGGGSSYPSVINAETSFSVSCTENYTTLATINVPSTGKYLVTAYINMPNAGVTLKSKITQNGTIKAGTSAYASDVYGSISHVLNLTSTTNLLLQAAVDVPFGGSSPQTMTGTYSFVKLAD